MTTHSLCSSELVATSASNAIQHRLPHAKGHSAVKETQESLYMNTISFVLAFKISKYKQNYEIMGKFNEDRATKRLRFEQLNVKMLAIPFIPSCISS